MRPATRIVMGAACALIAAATAAVYWPALAAGFVGDDAMILSRLRPIADVGDAQRFFRGEFFEYYRPLVFLAHSGDWLAAGADPRRFHLTNLLLHVANTALVFLIASARAMADELPDRRLAAGSVAAVLFGFHASNHEAVVWVSARFDLMATFWSLAAIWLVVKGTEARSATHGRGEARAAWATTCAAGALFFAALLSKESAVALPIVAAAWAVFGTRATTVQAVWRTAPWLAALVAYAVLRAWAGGTSPTGGSGRGPKVIALVVVLAGVAALGGRRLAAVRMWLRPRRALAVTGIGVAIVTAALAAALVPGAIGGLAREKLAVAGFEVFYLLSPVVDVTLTPHFLDPATNLYWLGGTAALAIVVVLVALCWKPLVDDERAWFAIAFLVASLIPISALTEGKRYLYLPSAAASLLAARLAIRAGGGLRRVAVVTVVGTLTVASAWQISRKVTDWIWAGRMTAEATALVDSTFAPACGGRVVFLTSPVAVRGVYTHFYYETFELPRGCRPDEFHVLVRVVRLDTRVDVRWEDPGRIVISAPDFRGNFVLSRDLRHFDLPLRRQRELSISTPIGAVAATGQGSQQRISLTLDPAIRNAGFRFFYYSEGRMHALPERATSGARTAIQSHR